PSMPLMTRIDISLTAEGSPFCRFFCRKVLNRNRRRAAIGKCATVGAETKRTTVGRGFISRRHKTDIWNLM
ncbi:MAG: hypothetical protein IJB65_03070, partial [Clostridia bacterium]|nr:hypothetical protein [Clostridia bacterium]